MFNADQKRAYIKSRVAAVDHNEERELLKLFSRTEKVEAAFGADFASLGREGAEVVLGSPGVLFASTFYTSVARLRRYALWCFENGQISRDAPVLKTEPQGLDEIRESMVANDTQLAIVIDELFPDWKRGTADTLIAAWLWMLYAGVDPQDSVRVLKSDVNAEKTEIRVQDHTYTLSGFSREAVLFAVSADRISIDHPQYDGKARPDSPYLLSGTSPVMVRHSLGTRLRKRCAEMEGRAACCGITPTSVGKSGMFHEMYKVEQAGQAPDFDDNVSRYMKLRYEKGSYGYKSFDEKKDQNRHKTLVTSFTNDYSRWKLAFLPDFRH